MANHLFSTCALTLLQLQLFTTTLAVPAGFFMSHDIFHHDELQLKAATTVQDELWPQGIIPYAIDPSFSQTHINDITEAMKRIQSKTCLQFRRNVAGDQYYIYFKNHNDYACGSYVGRQTSMKPQPLWVNPRCIDFNGLIHEVGHAIGIWHTQQRVDRDSYVTINWDALNKGEAKGQITKAQIQSAYTRVDQFERKVTVSNYNVPYDYSSIMHYPSNWGQISGVITPKSDAPKNYYGSQDKMAAWWNAPRDKVGLSQGDVEMISRMYSKECSRRRG